jgi:Holliday junction resolvase-like predicted endonuclease
MIGRLIFAIVNLAAPKGLAEPAGSDSAKQQARQTGVRRETYAYWYLGRHGYVLVARNYRSRGIKGAIDMIGYDGEVLAFVEVKTRSAADDSGNSSKPQVPPRGRQKAAKSHSDGARISARAADRVGGVPV